MAQAFKVLGQSSPAATTNTDVYTVGASTEAVISCIYVANRSGTGTSFRIAIRPNGDTIANQHYIYYDVDIPGNESFLANPGIAIDASDVITVYATAATLSFTFSGSEIT